MAGGTDGRHEHDEDCRALFREWLRYGSVAELRSGQGSIRYGLVAEDTGGFSPDDIANAARERAMFERQLRGLGCSVEALLAEWRAAQAEAEAEADED
ncbi:MAG: hypothetical protein CVU47_05575 [Chloroflexi bacterium HGW-Chloroflexi-9]|nr:MAG: hypothetical protein CVU47_05575 [Chloroflexi bacterium HGW-Chloroflexi-9]